MNDVRGFVPLVLWYSKSFQKSRGFFCRKKTSPLKPHDSSKNGVTFPAVYGILWV
jgi:hypothetical protein